MLLIFSLSHTHCCHLCVISVVSALSSLSHLFIFMCLFFWHWPFSLPKTDGCCFCPPVVFVLSFLVFFFTFLFPVLLCVTLLLHALSSSFFCLFAFCALLFLFPSVCKRSPTVVSTFSTLCSIIIIAHPPRDLNPPTGKSWRFVLSLEPIESRAGALSFLLVFAPLLVFVPCLALFCFWTSSHACASSFFLCVWLEWSDGYHRRHPISTRCSSFRL